MGVIVIECWDLVAIKIKVANSVSQSCECKRQHVGIAQDAEDPDSRFLRLKKKQIKLWSNASTPSVCELIINTEKDDTILVNV